MQERPEQVRNIPIEAPVKVGSIVTGLVDSLGDKGDGIVRVNGFVLIVPNCKEGETITLKVTRVLAKVGFGVRL